MGLSMDTELIFKDSVAWSAKDKTAISVRDGVINYYGFEIGQIPEDKVFTVFRSPATIAQASSAIVGVPVIEDHIDPDEDPEPDTIGGSVNSSEVIDHFDNESGSKLAIKNILSLKDEFLTQLDSGKRELSLGYKAQLIPHSEYDFEQRNITPRHLAIVSAGRCGSICSFIDKKEVKPMPKLHKAFADADGQPNLEEIVEIAQALPEAIKELPVDELQKIIPMLKEIVGSADEVEDAPEEEEVVVVDAEANEEEAEKKFEDAVAKVLHRHTEVIEKARGFVDESYKFTGKSTKDIMRDALKAQYDESFTDAELPVAFKLLKMRGTDVSSFGDNMASIKVVSLTDRVKQTLEG